jgi:flagellar motor switch protein FliN/FliY
MDSATSTTTQRVIGTRSTHDTDRSVATLPASAPAPPPPRGPIPPARQRTNIPRILGIELTLSAVVAQRLMSIDELSVMKVGTIIEFARRFDAELMLQLGEHAIGHGRAVKVGENFGLHITRISSVRERLSRLGPAV